MNRIVILTALGASALLAQDTLSTEAKQRWTQTRNNLIAASEKMDEANYEFKPAAESQSFKVLVAHTADSAMGTCSAFNGSPQKLGAAALASKAELVEALKKGAAECDKAYGSLTDAKATEMIEGRGGQRSRLGTLWGNTVHMEHEYAQMAVHLRLKGVVPPSSERGMGGKGGKK